MPPQFDSDDLSDGSRPLLNPTNPHTRPIHISTIVTSVSEQKIIPNAYLVAPIKEKCLHNTWYVLIRMENIIMVYITGNFRGSIFDCC